MSTGLPGEAFTAAAQVAGEVIRADANDPRWDGSKDNAAFAVEAITGIVKTALLPLAIVNRKATEYFERGLNDDLADALQDVPAEAISTPLPSIAGPALQGLGYSFEEEELRGMYVRLIASAMDGREPGKAHPSYATIVAALSAPEAQYLPIVLEGTHPVLEYRVTPPQGTGWVVLQTNVLPMLDRTTGTFHHDARLPEYLVNWQRLGLIHLDWGSRLSAPDAYTWEYATPYGHALLGAVTGTLETAYGVLRPTPFGQAFRAAVLPAEHTSQFAVFTPQPQIMTEPSDEPPQPGSGLELDFDGLADIHEIAEESADQEEP